MAAVSVPRFKSREAALRLYFRAGELLAPNAKPGGIYRARHTKRNPNPNLIDDFVALDSCFRGLNDVQLWMLRELYGPGCFIIRRIAFAELYERARRRFPERALTAHQVAQYKREALKLFEARLVRERLM